MIISDRTKKILYAAIFLLSVLAIAYLLYVVFFRTTTETPPTNTNNTNVNSSGLPNVNGAVNGTPNTNGINPTATPGIPGVDPTASGGPTKTSVLTPDTAAQNPTIKSGDSLYYYNPDDGRFYTVNANGENKQLSDAQFYNVQKATWSNTTDEAILEFPDGANIYYDFKTGKQVTLPKEFEEFDFSPTSKQIAFKYMHEDPERRVLAVSNPDGSSARTLEALGNNADSVKVEWSPAGTAAATFWDYTDFDRQEVGFVGLNDENFKGIAVSGLGLLTQYSTDGKQLLYSTYSAANNYQPELYIVDANGQDIGKNLADLQLNTFADKCAFNGNSTIVYCGVPSDPKYGFGLEPGVLEGVPDDIYQVNLSTGLKKKIATPVDASGNPTYAVDSLYVSSDDEHLFFRDKETGKLIKIDL